MKRFAIAVMLIGCHSGEDIAPAPPPLRPKPLDVDAPKRLAAKDDCEQTTPADEEPAKPFEQRSIPEAEKLAQLALSKLNAANGKDIDRATRENLITEAVNDFITALLADPYNITATYHLAAAYGRIGRVQCSVNLLKRLFQMRGHSSRGPFVEAKIDLLLGRNKQALDPDFNDMRDDVRFRTLIEQMCVREKDKECVLGSGYTGPK